MGDVGHVERSDLSGDPSDTFEVDPSGIGGRPGHDELRPALLRDSFEFVVVDEAVVVDAVLEHLEQLPGEIHLVAVRQVPPLIEPHPEDPVAGRERREVDRLVRLAPGMRLDVRMVRSEKPLRPVTGEVFGDVDRAAAAVVARPGVTFGVLVGKRRPGRGEDGRRDEVLRGDHLEAVALARDLLLDGLERLWVGVAENVPGGRGHGFPPSIASSAFSIRSGSIGSEDIGPSYSTRRPVVYATRMSVAVVLGSGRGVRRVDPRASYPRALTVLPDERTVLAWNLAALAEAGVDDVVFVAGYHVEKVVASHPDLKFLYHANWETEGDVAALVAASDVLAGTSEAVVFSAHVVFRPAALAALRRSGAPLVAGENDGAVLFLARGGGEGGTSAGGVARLLEAARALAAASPRSGLSDLVETLGADVATIRLENDLVSTLRPRALSAFVLGTKGETLERLRPLVRDAEIPPVYRFTVENWLREPERIRSEIREAFGENTLVVRSSSVLEDTWRASEAGRFASFLDVPPDGLAEAVEGVVASYRAAGADDGANEVLVQPYLSTARANGVLFTRHPDDGGPYRVVTFEEAAGRTDTVTAGAARRARTFLAYRRAGDSTRPAARPPGGCGWLPRLFSLAKEIEAFVHHDALDLEFAVDEADKIHLFQVRPIAEREEAAPFTDDDLDEELEAARDYVRHLLGPAPGLLGETNLLGVMPDWNPAEIVGAAPRPLALSLFQYLITDEVWAHARSRVGYRDLGPTPLVVSLAGRPFVDVRASFNSFLPADLPAVLGKKAVETAIARLRDHPDLHDKVEFEVMPTCLDAEADAWDDWAESGGWEAGERRRYFDALRAVTEGMVRGEGNLGVGVFERELAALAPRRAAWCERAKAGRPSRFAALRGLLEDCKRWGTLPFSTLARYAFVALALVRSLERKGVLDEGAREALLARTPTVASDFARDVAAYRRGELSREVFLARYGHLRPGTYDITVPSYAEAPERYIPSDGEVPPEGGPGTEAAAPDAARELLLSREAKVDAALRAAGFSFRATDLAEFVARSIPAREAAKFEYTKNICAAFSLLIEIGEDFGLSRDDLSYLPIERLLRLATDSPSAAERTELERMVRIARKRHAVTTTLRFPHLIAAPDDLDAFFLPSLTPNFITRERVEGDVALLGGAEEVPDLTGRIVAIENADPGYDWIFGRGIAGLVTAYGGAASHMAIRAAEFRLPAAIGCGEELWRKIAGARRIELDCAGERIRVIA